MFRANKQHLQGQLYSTVSELPPAQRQLLESSWAGTFRREVFARVDESALSVLYATAASRPNVPVNVLLGLEILKAGFGWTDEEMYEAFLFNVQVRYALGYEQLGDGYFAMRTVYELRRRLSRWMRERGENLLEVAFVQITDAQLQALKLKSETLRMDSTLVASDICKFTRLQLLVEILQRVQRMLSQSDQERYAELLAPYLSCKAGRYVYRLKHSEADVRLAAIGPLLLRLVNELAERYATENVYGLLVRVFGEHFVVCGTAVSLKPYQEVGARSLQAPDDPQATLHHKRGENYRGYVANVTETCDPSNPLQLIVKVQTQPNATDDAQLLVAALPELIERTEVKTLYTDGGYNSPSVDPLLHAAQIEHRQTALRGDRPHPDCVSLVHFGLETDAEGRPLSLTCPQGQRIPVKPGKAPAHYIARADRQRCTACPLLSRCLARPWSGAKTPTIYFDHRQLLLAQKRQAIASASALPGNPRAAVEATIRSLKQPFRHGKLLVRGCFRVACLLLGSALMVNSRRIHAYATAQPHKPRANSAFADLFFTCLAHIAYRGRCYGRAFISLSTFHTLRFPSSIPPSRSPWPHYSWVPKPFLQ